MPIDVTAKFAFQTYFTLDIKLHGIGTLVDHVYFHSNECRVHDLGLVLVEDIVPDVAELLLKSTNRNVREFGLQLVKEVDALEYPTSEVFATLGTIIMRVNALNSVTQYGISSENQQVLV